MFKSFKKQMQDAFAKLTKNQDVMFVANVEKDLMWETYIESFTDPIEKQEHTCNCCRSFIRNYGNMVVIDNTGTIKSIWDFDTDGEYKPAIEALNQLITNAEIRDVFFTKDKHAGTDKNKQTLESGGQLTWDHMYFELPAKFVKRDSLSIESMMGTARDNRNVFKRSLDEISVDALETVIELISQNSIYRGAEFKANVIEFLKYKKEYDLAVNKENYCWSYSVVLPPFISKIRNSAIGTLLLDISEGKELDYAVSAFERMVAPSNYKRPTAIATKSMIADAEKTINDLGLMESLGRRYATAEDVSATDLLFVNRDSSKLLSIFDEMKEDVPVNPKSFSKIEEVGIDDFIAKILPSAKSIEVFFENRQMTNLVSLITAKDKTAPSLFKWGNLESWSYTEGVADSMKERVKAAGGKVDGVLRYSIQWNEDGKSIVDLDAHAYEPDGTEIYYGSYKERNKTKMSGNLDVDMINPDSVGVENITWSDQSKMKKGVYKFAIKNFNDRRNTGFTAQVEFNGEIHEMVYDKHLAGKINIAEVEYDGNGNFAFKSLIPASSNAKVSSKTKWGLDTNKFHKVSMIMNSPNYWDREVGNKHVFFMLENAKSDEEPRGFFNEFLTEELSKQRKVFELLGGKLKVAPADKELSGLGFSSTQKNEVIVKVEGHFTRTIKVKF